MLRVPLPRCWAPTQPPRPPTQMLGPHPDVEVPTQMSPNPTSSLPHPQPVPTTSTPKVREHPWVLLWVVVVPPTQEVIQ